MPAPPLSDITVDDDLKMIESNRARVRALGSIVGTASSLVVTVSTGIVAYIYKADARNTSALPEDVRNVLFLAIGLAACALACVIGGFLIKPPFSAATKRELVGDLTTIYKREYWTITAAVVILFIALFFSAYGTWRFVDVAEPKPSTSVIVSV